MLKGMTLRKKIALLLTVSVSFVALAAWVLIYRIERTKVIDDNREVLSRYINAIAKEGEAKGAEGIKKMLPFWESVYPEGRLTLINATGDVLIDNKADPLEMDNHYKRPEIIRAFAEGESAELRYSKTRDRWENYMAKRLITPGQPGEGMVLRISYPVDKLHGLGWSMGKSFLYSLEIILLLVWGGAYWMLKVMMRPLNSLSRAAEIIADGGSTRFPITDDPEMQSLSNALNAMSDSLRLSIKEAQERKEEIALLVGTLPIGLVLIDDARKIRYMNAAASSICGRPDMIPSRGTSVEVVLPSVEICKMLDKDDTTALVSISRGGGMKVEVTTRTLARGRLIAMQDLTEKMLLEEARRDFFIDAGHEFQTPLTVIRMGLDLLKSDAGKDTEEIKTIESMIGQQERISGLVDDLLLLVRLDVDPFKTDIEDIDLAELGEELLSELKALPSSSGINVKVSFPEERALIRGRYTDLRRAVFNLLENGVKYVSSCRPSGEGEVIFSVTEADGMYEIRVDDNGCGIPESDRKIIFDRFRRGEPHRARNDRGSRGYGLGLSISRRVAERHGGKLELVDAKLGGASFRMTLPKK